MQKLPGICLKFFKKGILYLTPNRPKLHMWLVRYHSPPFLSTRSLHCEVLPSRHTELLESCSTHINVGGGVET